MEELLHKSVHGISLSYGYSHVTVSTTAMPEITANSKICLRVCYHHQRKYSKMKLVSGASIKDVRKIFLTFDPTLVDVFYG